jgi:hypothetical protein
VTTEPSRARSGVRNLYAAVFLVAGVAIAVKLWSTRGPALSIIALLTFATIATGVLVPAFRDWLRARPYLDAFVMLPASLSLLAFVTDLPFSSCLTIAVVLWLALTLLVTWRRHREATEARDSDDPRRRRGPKL